MQFARLTFFPALRALVLFSLLFGGLYPLTVTLINNLAFPAQSQGQPLLNAAGATVGIEHIGQNFASPRYFWGRLSATPDRPYNAAKSGGSNYSAANPGLVEIAKERIVQLKKYDPSNNHPIPADLVTASASGLDPDISLAAANYQASRVARIRKLPEEKIQDLIARFTSPRQLGMLGEPHIDLLKLNLALDGLAQDNPVAAKEVRR